MYTPIVLRALVYSIRRDLSCLMSPRRRFRTRSYESLRHISA
jgi:hypothetical protein